MDQKELEQIVAQVKQALAGREQRARIPEAGSEPSSPAPRLVTEALVLEAAKLGRTVIEIAPGAIITPLARDALRVHGIALASALAGRRDVKATSATSSISERPSRTRQHAAKARVAIGVVPTARSLEQVVMAGVRDAGLIGVHVPSPLRDAAHLARQVAGTVSGGQAAFGVIVEETGLVGPAIANRVQGVIAATCHDPLSARWARERLGANVLCVGAELVAPALLREIMSTWMASPATAPRDLAAVVSELDRQ